MKTIVMSLLFALTSVISHAEPMARTEQVEKKLARQKLLEVRERTVAQILANENELDLLTKYADGDSLEEIVKETAPAAGTAAVGAATDLLIAKKAPEKLAQLLARLPKTVRISIQRLPTIAGLGAAAYMVTDAVRMKSDIDRFKDMDDAAIQAELKRLLNARSNLADRIAMIDEQILQYDLELSRYE